MKSCIVIGSGIAGIAAAIRLKAQGFEVDVFESNDYPGGKLHAFTQDGFRFDAGPSLFTMPHFVEELFELSGENSKDWFQYLKCETACHYFYEDSTQFKCPSNKEELADEIHKQLGEDRNKIIKYLNKSERIYKITAPVFLEKSLHKFSTYWSKTGIYGIMNLWRLNMFSTMHSVNAKSFKNPKTTQFFDRYATYNGSNPYKAPATLNVIPHLEYGYGTYFPIKGMHSITTSLFELAKRKGVRFHFGNSVESILTEANKTKGIVVAGKTYNSDIVISNMDIYPTYNKLLKNTRMPNSVRKTESSSSALIFYWGIQKEFSELGLHNIFFSKNYKTEFQSIFEGNQVDDDPTVYINISSKHKNDDAPLGCENWFVMVNVPANSGQNWDEITSSTRKNVIKKISRILNTDISCLILTEKVLDPLLIEKNTSSFRGALYGSSSNHILSAFFRHANFKSSIKNLYFCGGSVHPGGGIPLCLLGAKIVSDLLKEDD